MFCRILLEHERTPHAVSSRWRPYEKIAVQRKGILNMDPSNAQATAPEEDYFTHYLNRTIMLLGKEAVLTLREKTIAIPGCGGHGGAACLTLARMGVGNFILADPKPFDEPDINRQWGANLQTLGRNKADVYAEMLLNINPEVKYGNFAMESPIRT